MWGCDLPGGRAREGPALAHPALAHSQFRLQGLTFLQVSQGPPMDTAAAMHSLTVQCSAVTVQVIMFTTLHLGTETASYPVGPKAETYPS